MFWCVRISDNMIPAIIYHQHTTEVSVPATDYWIRYSWSHDGHIHLISGVDEGSLSSGSWWLWALYRRQLGLFHSWICLQLEVLRSMTENPESWLSTGTTFSLRCNTKSLHLGSRVKGDVATRIKTSGVSPSRTFQNEFLCSYISLQFKG